MKPPDDDEALTGQISTGRDEMKQVLGLLLGVAVVAVSSLAAIAAENDKKCKPGQQYDESKRKCVVIRGS